jgi:ubiquinone/menaquinone biosynthesis C-methylase UbiE
MRSAWLARIYEAWWRPLIFGLATGFRMPRAEEEAAIVLREIDGTAGPWLDLSCGPGNITRRLVARSAGRQVVALDSSFAMLERARVRAPAATCVLADAAKIPFAEGTFGAVVNLAALDLYSDAAAVVVEAVRVLKPGGRWIASSFVRARALPSRAAWQRFAGICTPTEQEIVSYAALAGLVRLRCVCFGSYVIASADKPPNSEQDEPR